RQQVGRKTFDTVLVGTALAVAFAVSHMMLIYQSLGPATVGANDVRLYAWWMGQAESTGQWPGIDTDWVYPVGALAPLLVASILGTGAAYLPAWCAMVGLINLAVTVVSVRRFGLAPAAGPLIGWFVFLMLLGPCAMTRLDAVMMPLVLVALVVASGRPALASVLLTGAAWIKVAGGAVLIPLFAIVRSWSRRVALVVLPAAVVSAAVVVLQLAGGGGWRVLTSFVGAETDRGLQVEAVLATPVVLAHARRGEQIWEWNDLLGTCETWGAGAEAAIRVSDIAMPLAALAVGLLAWLARRRAGAALLVGALAMMSGLIVTHKVGSPQFVAWLAPPAVVALCQGRRPRFWLPVSAALLVTAALTGQLYPAGYTEFLSGDRLMLTIWTVRNLLLVAVFAAALAELVRLWRSSRPGAASASAPAPPTAPTTAADGRTRSGTAPGTAPRRPFWTVDRPNRADDLRQPAEPAPTGGKPTGRSTASP
ncbi:MAG: hypothetical protein LBG60_13710, partial [Bifidobacteriaceae bacterium]|nr:hypothetical protein [Bifidobacteriaceae bacterium]